MIERRTFVWHDIEHPAFVATGAAEGPRLSLIGGVHGCEYSSIAAVTRVMNELDTSELAGTITAVPVVSMESFRRRSPFVVPVDGKNLNRNFPGKRDGTYTEVLARSIFDDVIAPADVLLDLHGGDQVEGLEPFAIYEASPVEERAHAIATAFNLPYVVREERTEGGLGGLTTSAAGLVRLPLASKATSWVPRVVGAVTVRRGFTRRAEPTGSTASDWPGLAASGKTCET